MTRDPSETADGPIVVGLTGSIGMGKSTTAGMFRARGIPVHDSDAAVHALYQAGGKAAEAVGKAFPGVLSRNGAVDRDALRQHVLGDAERVRRLEALVHPLVQAEGQAFLDRHADARVVVLDIPLLFETGAEGRCDAVVVVSAPAEVQRERVLARPGMSEAAFRAILARQLPDDEKRRRADFVIDTGRGLASAERQVGEVLARLSQARGKRGTGRRAPRGRGQD